MGARYPDDYYGQRRVRVRSSWVLLSRRMIPRYPRGPLGNGTDFSISRKDKEISSKPDLPTQNSANQVGLRNDGKRVEKAQNQTAGNTIVLLVLPFELGENRHFKDVSC